MKKVFRISIALLVYALLTYLVLIGVYYNGTYPSGSDTMFHLYRGDLLYDLIQEGQWFPLLDPNWYSGVEILRYWAPLPAYVLAFCQFAAGGSIFDGYLLFVGLMVFFNAVAWLIVGISRKRIVFGAFIGALWFFMPNNLYALFEEGNLPRTICMIFLPLFIHYLYGYMHEDRKSSLFKMMICSFFMVLCHLGYAGMIFFAVIIWLLVYVSIYKKFKATFNVILGIVFSFLWTGVWAVASLKGGITSGDTSQAMAIFFQDIGVSLNPFYRIENGLQEFYFGCAAFVLGVFGILFAKKKAIPGFCSGIIICLCTTTAMYPIICKLPGSQYFLMLRFISIALCFILFSFLLWDTLKKQFKVLICILLVLDIVPSLGFVYGNLTGETVEERMERFAEDTLLDRAKEVTAQRMAFMDAATTGATGAYVSSAYSTKTAITFGAGWEGATTSVNIRQLNQALEDGLYLYLFDRCLEMGNDTVLLRVDQMKNKSDDIADADEAARRVGYSLVEKNEDYRLYHMETPESFGVVSEYQAIGIGSAVDEVSIAYPAIEKGVSDNLNDYSFEELSKYRLVYLDGFTCSNYAEAEALVVRLSEAGVRVVISADGIPKDERIGKQEFLGVSCHNIQFSYGYPILYTTDKRWDLDLFAGGYTEWNTVYIEGMDECLGYIEDKGEVLEFFGTVRNDNIVFIGLNLVYHTVLTKDASAMHIVGTAMGEGIVDTLPERMLVPIEITYIDNRIIINTEYDDVNTTIAYHDNFVTEQEVWQEHTLTYVNSGMTEIRMHYPYLKSGLIVSVVGIVGSIVFLFVIKKKKKAVEEYAEKEEKGDDDMIQREYQFKFFLNASHSMDINGKPGQKHSHTWEIVITVEQNDGDFKQFNEMEKNVVAFLSNYQDKYLNEIPPFNTMTPNQENLMDFFTEEITEIMENSGWILLKTEISENPTRSYMIVTSETAEEMEGTEVTEEFLEACENDEEDIQESIMEEAAVATELSLVEKVINRMKKSNIDPKLFSKAAGITSAVLIGLAYCGKKTKR